MHGLSQMTLESPKHHISGDVFSDSAAVTALKELDEVMAAEALSDPESPLHQVMSPRNKNALTFTVPPAPPPPPPPPLPGKLDLSF